jgi:hypothetical protein
MKKLPKAQLGAIIKGIKVGASAGNKAYKAAKIVKPKVLTKPKKLTGSKDISIPAYIATYGGGALLAAAAAGAFNKKKTIKKIKIIKKKP